MVLSRSTATLFPVHRLDSPAEQRLPFRLGIIIPLKSRSVARSWLEVEKRLRATVGSLCRQSSAAWEAVIVGHERPELPDWTYPNLSFITLDQAPPTLGPDGRLVRNEAHRDLHAKKVTGMRFLADGRGITHWFHLDADDLVHEHFVATVSRMVPFDIAVVRRGYAYYPARRRYRRLDQIDRFCGSTVLTSDRWWKDPDAPEGRQNGGTDHRSVTEYAALRGVSLHEYPGRGVAYVLGHGDNIYRTIGRRVRVWFESRFLSGRCDAEFFESFGAGAAG